MPREAARMHRVITDVRAMRVQQTTEAEARAEGVTALETMDQVGEPTGPSFVCALVQRWDELHNKPGERWADNPWVWRYKLEVSDEPVSG